MKFSLISLSLALILPAFAAPEWEKKVNIPQSGALLPIKPVHLSYNLSWNGKLKAGTVDITFGKKDPKYPKHFLTQSWGGSTGWASVLYPFQFNYISFLSPKTLRPVMFVGNEVAKRKDSNYQFRFKKSGVNGVKKSVYKNGKKNKEQKRSFDYPSPLDLFSGLLQIRSMPLDVGQTYVMPFYPVGKPYLCTIKVLKREKHLGQNAIKLSVALQGIDEKLKLKEYKKLKSSNIWISDDQWRIPIEVRAKVWVGDVRMTLKNQKAL